jgi:hypothetical protein
MRKHSKFHIIIEANSGESIVDNANTVKEVEEWLSAFKEQTQAGTTIRVYERLENSKKPAYKLVRELTKAVVNEPRLVGFGRW